MAPALPAILALGPAAFSGWCLGRRSAGGPSLRSAHRQPVFRGDGEPSTARGCGAGGGAWPGSGSIASSGSTLLLLAFLVGAALAVAGCGGSGAADDDFDTCEGYWAPAAACVPLGLEHPSGSPNAENKDCPQWRMDPAWTGRSEFLQRLTAIEDVAKEADAEVGPMTQARLARAGLEHVDWINLFRYRGLAPSRIEEKRFVGSNQFVHADESRSLCWADGYSWYYVAKHSVVPSKKFQRFVSSFDLQAFKDAVRKVMQLEQQPGAAKAGGDEEQQPGAAKAGGDEDAVLLSTL